MTTCTSNTCITPTFPVPTFKAIRSTHLEEKLIAVFLMKLFTIFLKLCTVQDQTDVEVNDVMNMLQLHHRTSMESLQR